MKKDNAPLQQQWAQVLTELQTQLTRSTFDTWVKHTTPISLKGKQLVIAVPNTYTVEWLNARLKKDIQRAVESIMGKPYEVEYVVRTLEQTTRVAEAKTKASANADATFSVVAVSANINDLGFTPTTNYELYFWQPYLGVKPFVVWAFIKSFEYRAEYDPEGCWPSITRIAETCTCGDRKAIVGRNGYKGRPEAREGVLQLLERQHLLKVTKSGAGIETDYVFHVVKSLPWLTPAQTATLSPKLQLSHKDFLERAERKLTGFKVSDWEQIKAPSLLNASQWPS